MEHSSTLLYFFFFSISTINALLASSSADVLASDYSPITHETQALMAFKRGITRDPLGRLASWVIVGTNPSATNPCKGHQSAGGAEIAWNGIVCDSQKQHVIRVSLRSCNLTGTISPSLIASLPALSHLDLSDNSLSGSLPTNLFVPQSALQYLNLSHNSLSGGIPSSIGQLSSLINLDLSYNGFVNTLPSSITMCPKLETLLLQETGMTGLIPDEVWQLPALKVLTITDKESGTLSGVLPEHFGFCQSIIDLDLETFNAAGSTIPSSLGECRQLKLLVLDIPGLEGTIPPGIWQLPSLQVLVVRDQQQSGKLYGTLPQIFGFCHTIVELRLFGWNGNGSAIPSALANCQQLEILVLSLLTGLQGSIPTQIWQLPALQELVLQDLQTVSVIDAIGASLAGFPIRPYQLHGSFPSQLRACPTLTVLSIDGIDLTGEIPPSLSQCTALQLLDLSHGSLQGSIPETFHNLSSLEALYLQSNNLSGNIPPQLSACTSLVALRLGGNAYLRGKIPRELGGLANLQVLSLFSVSVSGPFPEELCNCTELSWLDVGFQRLTHGIAGRLPDCFARLAQLQTLAWQFNPIGGEIPIRLLSNLTQLQYLDLSWCMLQGGIPWELSNLSSLHHLGLGQNNLSGSIPAQFGQLQYVETIDFNGNQLNSSIPEGFLQGLANASTITTLDLGGNHLQGKIPDSIGRLKSLQILHMALNSLHGMIPWTLANLTALQDLDLHGNLLEGGIPPALGQLTTLNQNLLLSGNRLSGQVPAELGQLAHLQLLDLSKNALVGSFPKFLENCSNLQVLRLFQNGLSGKIENLDLLQFPQLQRFMVGNNSFDGGLPRGFVNNPNLVLFNVQRNSLSGSFSSPGAMVHGLASLRVLLMSFNKLSGEIPQWLWSLPMLQVLDLSNNHFTGKMPATVSNLTYFKQDHSYDQKLSTLYEEVPVTIKYNFEILSYVPSIRMTFDVSMNDLEGEIADSFGELVGLTGLNLSHNRIQGSIPKSLEKLVRLEALDLSHNNLSGGIPPELGLLGLSALDLSYNKLQGPIPVTDNFDTRFSNTSFENNPGLWGHPLTVDCTSTSPGGNSSYLDQVKPHARSPGKKLVDFVSSFASLWGLLLGYLVGLSSVAYVRHRYWN